MSKVYSNGQPVEHPHELHEHVSPISLYNKIIGTLFVLTALTYAVSFANLGPASLTVAMLVATVKAALVVGYFMHLKYDEKYHLFVFLGTIIFVAIFFGFTLFDMGARERAERIRKEVEAHGGPEHGAGHAPAAGAEHGAGHGEAKAAH